MSLRLASLASGSSGNAVYLEGEGTRILVDCGISYKSLCLELEKLGTVPSELDAVLITHEHHDHVSGLRVLMKKCPDLPVYASRGSFEGLSRMSLFPSLPKGSFRLFRAGDALRIGSFSLESIPVSHDAEEPVCFTGNCGERGFALVTDLGLWDDALAERMRRAELLYLEFNHERTMLETGIYPYPLKLRIAGAKGHLSNEAAGQLLAAMYHPGLKAVLLAHLSQENNMPLLAKQAARLALMTAGLDSDNKLIIDTAPPRGLSRILECE